VAFFKELSLLAWQNFCSGPLKSLSAVLYFPNTFFRACFEYYKAED